MATEQDLKEAKQKLSATINKGLEKPTLDERLRIGLITGVIASAFYTALTTIAAIPMNKWHYKRPWNDGFSMGETLGGICYWRCFFWNDKWNIRCQFI